MSSNRMLEQIFSLPEMVEEMTGGLGEAFRGGDPQLWRAAHRVFLTGCGDSHHAALAAELAFQTLAGVDCRAQTAMQFARYTAPFLRNSAPGTSLVVGISVSGEVARTLEALLAARAYGGVPIALTANPTSRIAQAAGWVIPAAAPVFPETPGTVTPGVRTFTANLLTLYGLAIHVGQARGKLSAEDAGSLRAELVGLAGAMRETIEVCAPAAERLVRDWRDADEFVFTGSGPNYGTALYSAAKILEASGDRAVGQDSEEWAHLQYFARAIDTPTFVICAGGADTSRANEVATAARAIERRVVAIAPRQQTCLRGAALAWLTIPDGLREMFSPLVAAVPGMLVAAYRAELIGEPFFRAFSGGRSIEGGGGISRIRDSEILVGKSEE